MYQAIVFLPLLGCIVAGPLAGFPGGTPSAGAHAAPQVREDHPRGAPPLSGAAGVYPSHDESDEPQPAAVGSREAELVTTALLFASMVLSWIAFFYVGFG